MRKSLIFILTLGAFSLAAHGQVAEIGVYGGANRHSNNEIGTLTVDPTESSQVTLDDGWKFGFRVTFNNARFFGHELGYGYNRTQLNIEGEQQGMAIHQGFYNFLVYGTPEGSRIRPFATGGVHFANYTPPGSSATYGQGDTKFGINYGGGIKARISQLFLIRFDVRRFSTPKPFDLPNANGWLNQLEVSAGFSLAL